MDAVTGPIKSQGTPKRNKGRDERGEALPVAILFVGVLTTILIGIHVVLMAMARTAVQAAADRAVATAQVAGSGPCGGDSAALESERECAGVRAAHRSMMAARTSITERRPARVTVEEDRGVVSVRVFGAIRSPLLGRIDLSAEACGPLDDVPAWELVGTDAWEC